MFQLQARIKAKKKKGHPCFSNSIFNSNKKESIAFYSFSLDYFELTILCSLVQKKKSLQQTPLSYEVDFTKKTCSQVVMKLSWFWKLPLQEKVPMRK
jgi:hypothetical protein